MDKNSSSLSLNFAPLLDTPYLWLIAILGLIALTLSAYSYRRALPVRTLAFVAFMLILLNPSLLREDRSYVRDTAVIIVDQSMSQSFGERTQRTEIALQALTTQLKDFENLDVITLIAPEDGNISRDTKLFHTLDMTLANIPQSRRAGVIILSDGQIHDIPVLPKDSMPYGPLHLLLSGEHNEKDRRITLINAPAYGLIGKNVTVKYKVEDTQNINERFAQVTLTSHEGTEQTFSVPVNTEQSIDIPVDHPAQNVFELSVSSLHDELTLANNSAPILINGVRDRLKVLLVSGKPYPGERTWRDLLTSDPGVDLVHFTILREPEKIDYTPTSEMSLIAFPFDELFQVKL